MVNGEEGLLQFVEPELMNIFRPLRAMLAPLCMLRCVYAGGRPRAPPASYACYQACWLLVASVLFAYSLMSAHRHYFFFPVLIKNSLYFAVSVLSVTRILVSNRRGKVVKLLHEIQDIDRRLRFPRTSVTHASLRRRNVVWTAVLVAFHSSYRAFEFSSDPFIDSFWPVALVTTAGLDADLVSFVSHTRVVCARLRYLNGLLRPGAAGGGGRDVDLLACYKKILHALKLINNIWRFQLLVLYVSEFVFTIHYCWIIMIYYSSTRIINAKVKLLVKVLFVLRQLMMLVMPGVCGQRLQTLLDDTWRACGHTGTTHCARQSEREVRSGIVRLQVVQQPGLTAGGPPAPRLDGRWPLTVLSALATTFILILQLNERPRKL